MSLQITFSGVLEFWSFWSDFPANMIELPVPPPLIPPHLCELETPGGEEVEDEEGEGGEEEGEQQICLTRLPSM